jgi:predicted phage terminase large subunit-like protein
VSTNPAVLDALPYAREILKARKAKEGLAPRWVPMNHQIPPDGQWHVWLLEGGRGSGKTDGAAAYVNRCAVESPIRISIIAPTLGDAVESCVNGPSGLKAHNSAIRLTQGMGGVHVRWPNGSEAKLFGAFSAEDVERLRAGGNRHLVWAEELAAWVKLKEAWDQMEFGLRLGERPRIVATTTPKPRKPYLAIRSDPRTILTGAPTLANPHLHQSVRDALERAYAGTRIGRQELNAEILTDVPGALWTYASFEDRREPPDMARVVVAVDPSGGDDAENAEQGIVVAGLGVDGRGYVLADRSCRLSPDGWGRRAIQAYLDHEADRIVWESNYGGQMVESNIKTVARDMGVTVATKKVVASRGKQLRAEPVAALFEQGKVSLVPGEDFDDLIDQCTTWTQQSGTSPDRLDALVWALTELRVDQQRRAGAF